MLVKATLGCQQENHFQLSWTICPSRSIPVIHIGSVRKDRKSKGGEKGRKEAASGGEDSFSEGSVDHASLTRHELPTEFAQSYFIEGFYMTYSAHHWVSVMGF